jgi:hypothetical protein
MLRRGWMLRYLPEIVSQNVPESMIVAAGYSWAALIAALGLINLVIALNFDFMTWAWFISLGSVGAKFALFSLQYAAFRAILRQRTARAATVEPANLSRASARLPPEVNNPSGVMRSRRRRGGPSGRSDARHSELGSPPRRDVNRLYASRPDRRTCA